VHEAPRVMWVPYVILAIATVAIGLMGPIVESFFGHSLELTATSIIGQTTSLNSATEEHAVLVASLGSLAMLMVGGVLGYFVYFSRRLNLSSLISQSGPVRGVYNFLWNRWYINPVYYRIFVYGTISSAVGLWKTIELGFFDKISDGVANLSLGISNLGQRADLGIVDGTINNIASSGRGVSSTLKKIETGIPQDYVTVFVIGLFVLIVAILFFI